MIRQGFLTENQEAFMGILVASFVAFFPLLGSYFAYDDFAWLSLAKGTPHGLYMALTPSPGGWTTPVSNWFFFLEFRLFGLGASGYYLVNILLHIANSFLVYWLVRLLSKSWNVAFLSALFFAIAFSHYEAVTSIAAFLQLLVCFFYALCMIFFVLYLHKGLARFYLASLLCFVLALLSKETAVTLLGALFLCEIVVLKSLALVPRTIAIRYLPFAIVFLGYCSYEYSFQLSQTANISSGRYQLAVVRLLHMKYLRHLVIPNIDLPPIKVYLDTILSPLLLQMIRFLTTGITFIGMLAALYFVVKGPRLIRFNIFWMCLSFLPFSFFNEQLAVAPRYLYIPSISFSVLLALLVIHIYTAIRNNGWGKRTFLLSSVILIAVFNILPMWVWEIRWQENGMERRSIVSQLKSMHPEFPAGSEVVIAIPHPKFSDVVEGLPIFYTNDIVSRAISPSDLPRLQGTQDTYVFIYEQGELHEWHRSRRH